MEILQKEVYKLNVSEDNVRFSELTRNLNLLLNAIRFNLIEIARRGMDISKWYKIAERILARINHFIGMENLALCDSQVVDNIFGIPVRINDNISGGWAAVASFISPKNNISDPKTMVSTFMNTIDAEVDEMLGNYDNVIRTGGFVQDNAIDAHICVGEQITTIIISNKVYELKQSNPKMYEFIIAHELAHYHMASHIRQNDPSYIDAAEEINADDIAMNLSGIDKESILKLYDEFTKTAVKELQDDIRTAPRYVRNNSRELIARVSREIVVHRLRLKNVLTKK